MAKTIFMRKTIVVFRSAKVTQPPRKRYFRGAKGDYSATSKLTHSGYELVLYEIERHCRQTNDSSALSFPNRPQHRQNISVFKQRRDLPGTQRRQSAVELSRALVKTKPLAARPNTILR